MIILPNDSRYLLYKQRVLLFHSFAMTFLVLPSPKQQILASSKLKEFADNNFKFNENGRKLSKQGENTVGKGEIARKEQFLLFAESKELYCRHIKRGIVWGRDNARQRCINPSLEYFFSFLLKYLEFKVTKSKQYNFSKDPNLST